jgi:hypothetical protein
VAKQGLYANIHAKRERIKAGSGEKMNKVGSKNAPTAQDFKESAKTAKPSRKDMIREKMKDM